MEHEEKYTTFGDIVKNRRNELNLTQKSLALRLNISAGYIARIERNYSVPVSKIVLKDLANGLEMDAQELIHLASLQRSSITKQRNRYPKTFDLIMRTIAVLTEEERRRTIIMFEQRIGLFGEPSIQLAENFSFFLLGELALEDTPKNGLRPLIHYFEPWDKVKINWKPAEEDHWLS